MNQPTKVITDRDNKEISASIFENQFGNAVILQITFMKDRELQKRYLTIFPRYLDSVIEILKSASNYIDEQKSIEAVMKIGQQKKAEKLSEAVMSKIDYPKN